MNRSAVQLSVPQSLLAVLDQHAPQQVEPAMLLPANDYFDLAGEEFGSRLLLTIGADGGDYCLRPDYTLPIAQDYMARNASGAETFGYCGRVFRQREGGPAEFTQMGLELLGHDNADQAFDKVLSFVADAFDAVGLVDHTVTFGSIAMFETLLKHSGVPELWWPRVRHRFGNRAALADLIARLGSVGPHDPIALPERSKLVDDISERMLADGLSLTEGRTPDEIADRMLEKLALANADVPDASLQLLSDYLAIAGELGTALDAVKALGDRAEINFTAELAELAGHGATLRQHNATLAQSFDAGFAPRLFYYTGTVFAVTDQAGEPIASGGEYDRMLKSMGADRDIAASGVAIWVERLLAEAGK